MLNIDNLKIVFAKDLKVDDYIVEFGRIAKVVGIYQGLGAGTDFGEYIVIKTIPNKGDTVNEYWTYQFQPTILLLEKEN